MTQHYRTDTVYKKMVVDSAIAANATAFFVNLLLAVTYIGNSRVAGCETLTRRYEVVGALVGIYIMVFIAVFLLMCSMFILMSRPAVKN